MDRRDVLYGLQYGALGRIRRHRSTRTGSNICSSTVSMWSNSGLVVIVLLQVLFLIITTYSRESLAFPEMVRHGYVNCNSCHVSPTGGGILTQYGRELSRELLSQGGTEEESLFAWNTIKTPDWLNLGGDLRGLIVFKDSPIAREGRAIPMQTDLEMVVSTKRFLIGGTVGYNEDPRSEATTSHFISRRHYLAYQLSEELSFRGGRFMPSFGINVADHAIVTKAGLNWNQSSEAYNFESAWLGERFNLIATAVFGRPDNSSLDREKGYALNAAVAFLDKIKVGLSYFQGSDRVQKREASGPWGILGFAPDFFLLTEIDFQNKTSLSTDQQVAGVVNYNKIDYEFFQGFHGFCTIEFERIDFSKNDMPHKFFGLGIQYFPRPHFEISFTLQKQIYTDVDQQTDLAFILLHVYL